MREGGMPSPMSHKSLLLSSFPGDSTVGSVGVGWGTETPIVPELEEQSGPSAHHEEVRVIYLIQDLNVVCGH